VYETAHRSFTITPRRHPDRPDFAAATAHHASRGIEIRVLDGPGPVRTEVGPSVVLEVLGDIAELREALLELVVALRGIGVLDDDLQAEGVYE
jgi:hypothetical protein